MPRMAPLVNAPDRPTALTRLSGGPQVPAPTDPALSVACERSLRARVPPPPTTKAPVGRIVASRCGVTISLDTGCGSTYAKPVIAQKASVVAVGGCGTAFETLTTTKAIITLLRLESARSVEWVRDTPRTPATVPTITAADTPRVKTKVWRL